MNEHNNIKSVFRNFVCSRSPIIDSITTDLWVNSMESTMTIDKPIIKDIKKRLASLVEFTVNTTNQVDCDLHTMQAIHFL